MSADEFIVLAEGAPPYTAFFEQDDETGYLYISDGSKVISDLHIYNRERGINLSEDDVRVVWNESCDRAAVVIGGRIRGVLGLTGDCYRPPMHSLESEGVSKEEWLIGFQTSFDVTAEDRRPKTDD